MPKETQHIVFKPNFNEDVIETPVAFANTKGGNDWNRRREYMYIIVDDKKKDHFENEVGNLTKRNKITSMVECNTAGYDFKTIYS